MEWGERTDVCLSGQWRRARYQPVGPQYVGQRVHAGLVCAYLPLFSICIFLSLILLISSSCVMSCFVVSSVVIFIVLSACRVPHTFRFIVILIYTVYNCFNSCLWWMLCTLPSVNSSILQLQCHFIPLNSWCYESKWRQFPLECSIGSLHLLIS